MQWLKRFFSLPAIAAAMLTFCCTTAGAMTEADKFVGAWRLVSAEYRSDDGALIESPFGAEPEGMLMYDSFGNMSVQIAGKNRQRFAASDRLAGTGDEIKSAFESYTAYFGRYSVDEREREVTHSVRQSLFPNHAAAELRRFYNFADRKLTLRTPPFLLGGKTVTGVLLWDKIR
ncbi:MAG: lipocalin-like domain-containing protein [Burkholderiales bacterium]